jgi:hypothetical protein
MDRMALVWQRPITRIVAAILLMLLGLAGAAQLNSSPAQANDSPCKLGPDGQIRHVIYIQFDNVHFTRDNPNVPSDLEQMPNLLNFIEGNGILDDNYHTPLIAHTANDILTSLTGLYPSEHGVPIANSYRYFLPNGKSNTGVSFAYWTSPLFDPSNPPNPTDVAFNMITGAPTAQDPNGVNTPAPWVPYTRAGCNFGSTATANTILENTGIDVPTVFGANSPEATEVQQDNASSNAQVRAQPQADFVGIGIHCAQGAALCSDANHARPDLLPDEPDGYSGFNGLFGAKYVDPLISSPDADQNGNLTDLNGNTIQDPTGNPGFPGFDGMSAAVSLSYVAHMQEHGVPVTYAYISDAHDNHPSGPAFGPGAAGYVQALQAYDKAFGEFFNRLAKDGINKNNTLFVFSADENDHFVGGAPSPANCDGVTIPCTYSQIGEINANLAGLLATETGNTTSFSVHSDSAPNFYITGNPGQTSQTTRQLERDVDKLTAVNPMTGNTDNITQFLADQTEMNLLHMMSADPARNPNFTMFADPDYFLFSAAPNCTSPCVTQPSNFAWNHGDVSPDINVTWLGIVGPGIRHLGVTGGVWSDQTDIRPTMMNLLHLKDDYAHDGRVLFEFVNSNALPDGLRDDADVLSLLAQVYKEINAPVNDLGLDSLKISTAALKSNTANDSTYTNLEAQLAQFTKTRNSIASQMISMLEGAAFKGHGINEKQSLQLIFQAEQLLNQVFVLAESVS